MQNTHNSVSNNPKPMTGKEKKALALEKWRNRHNVPRSAQETIPYQQMHRSGICLTEDGYYTKTIRFFDINYQLAQNEDKTAIFDNWCDFLNYFDSSIHVQLTFNNQHVDFTEYQRMIDLPAGNDNYDSIREEYTHMLRDQLSKGTNGLEKSKYITFGIQAKNLKEAKARLERIETDIINNFKVLDVRCESMNGYDRLKLLHDMMNGDTKEPFRFSYDLVNRTGLNTRDFIAPTSFKFGEGRYFRMGSTIGAASYLQIIAPELSDRLLADVLDMDSDVLVNIHIQSIDQVKAIKMVKGKLTDLDRMKIEEQKKAIRSGYDMDIIPSDLATYGSEAKKLLQDLQGRNERMFLVTVLVVNTAQSKQRLDNLIFQTSGLAQKYNCALRRLDYQQENALMSSLPLGVDRVPVKRSLTTSATAIFVPFTTQELFHPGHQSLYYGLNALSNNMIMVDRKQLKNPNGLILGTPGSGKSFSAKREITNVFLMTDDDVIICDPEAEYGALVEALDGQIIHISPNSHDYINPMDINLNYSEDRV